MSKTTPPAQDSLQLATPDGGTTNVEKYAFEPIKGYPMLNWRGRRPFTATQFYPAQLKEVFGEEVDGWRNKIFWGDNLQVMSHLMKQFRGKVDMVYIDPPFDSKADYRKKIHLKGKTITGDIAAFEEKQYGDLWSNDEYLQFMYERLVLLRELLTEEGSIWVQCDWHRSHHIRCLLEEVFGPDNFLNEVIWQRTDPHNDAKSRLGIIHDTVFWVAKKKDKVFYDWQAAAGDLSASALSEYSLVRLNDGSVVDYSEETEKLGKRFKVENTTYKGKDSKRQFEWRGVRPSPNRVWAYSSPEEMDQALERGDLYLRDPSKGSTRCKVFFLEESNGRLLQTIWTDCGRMKGGSDYPTRKPEQLLERIITAGCPVGGIVLDTFVGSGTTAVVAQKLGRRFIAADINLGAVQSSTKRLSGSADDLRQQLLLDEERRFIGLEVYNVNNYDIFRNPTQARELLLEALEIQKLEFSTVFDGEKDGRMVKIMPVNRIATRADLNELIAGFDYKAWERRKAEAPTRPVEKVTLVCMGHESDLAAQLVLAAKPYLINVEVVDILRDKSNLEFKRDSEAKVVIKNGELVIERFYPMNLLQKLSLQKESAGDWRELVESVLIDWNYDGAVLQPASVDIPDKNELVAGKYKVPSDAGTIRVKITDLLSESWEGSINNG
ncbi:site-specific DNA-methyltransferase [Pseudoxanthomonas jiangsuensis]|uniref:site-specific DNA-methyltransferase n=1 Tax=Pseudoxanthomonas jiangsuensis TaxID=619688 RepID=UPI001391E41B|nr:site-specific DNA-methyltransferase [Pseudoxanthomonas jiangsuensis]KAF1691554.1 site-specific DNA-methyltransferase [Pseudoxanthomonas jiangsuensis]